MKTVREVAEKLLPGKTFDYALPLDFVNDFKNRTGLYPAGNFVWLYDENGGLFGRPFPITPAGVSALLRWNGTPGTFKYYDEDAIGMVDKINFEDGAR